MKAKFWVTFEADMDQAQTKVKAVRAANMTQGPPKAARGVPIAFEVEVPDELFLSRMYTVEVTVPPPATTAPVAIPGSAWEAAKARHGA